MDVTAKEFLTNAINEVFITLLEEEEQSTRIVYLPHDVVNDEDEVESFEEEVMVFSIKVASFFSSSSKVSFKFFICHNLSFLFIPQYTKYLLNK
jgi:hypothetical protein